MELTAAFCSGAAALIIAFLFVYRRHIQSKSPQLNLPPSGPLSLPVIGHLLHILKPPLHRSLAQIGARYGSILLLRFGSRPILLVSSPDIAEECFKKHDVVFANRPFVENGMLLSYDYTILGSAPYGSYWRNLRRITNTELFTPARINALAFIRSKEVHHLIRDFTVAPGRVELKPKFKEMLLNIIMLPLAGKRYSGESDVAVLEERRRILWVVDEVFRLTKVSNPEDSSFPQMAGIQKNWSPEAACNAKERWMGSSRRWLMSGGGGSERRHKGRRARQSSMFFCCFKRRSRNTIQT